VYACASVAAAFCVRVRVQVHVRCASCCVMFLDTLICACSGRGCLYLVAVTS
jgi:hypothetical protein